MYKPRLDWLEELLASLNDQTYENIELLVWNDCPDDCDHDEVFSKYLTRIPFRIYHGEQNAGSNMAFQRLTGLAKGAYIAYCDQDDIWLKEKIATLIQEMKDSSADLVYSDMQVMDENSKLLADSITKVRKHQSFYDGKDNFAALLRKNCVTGCTILVKTDLAKKALPFPKEIFHDYWLALYASAYGKMHFCAQPLIRYRVYGQSQSASMKGITCKHDYYEKRILFYLSFMKMTAQRIRTEKFKKEIYFFMDWAEARQKYFMQPGLKSFYSLLKKSKRSDLTTFFELLLPFIPEPLFCFLVKEIRKGKL